MWVSARYAAPPLLSRQFPIGFVELHPLLRPEVAFRRVERWHTLKFTGEKIATSYQQVVRLRQFRLDQH
jgi:hypothetical protein